MSYPKYKYRIHPTLGFHQSTLVVTAAADAGLDADWSDTKPDGFTEGYVPGNTAGIIDLASPVTSADIVITTTGDMSHG